MLRSVWLIGLLAVAMLSGAGCRRKKYENPITKDTQQPDKVLFDKAINDIEKGRFEVARITLNTLMNTYDTSEFMAKSKLAIGDSWFREGGSHAWAQAEAEYKDFILFYPTLEESAEAQMKVCDIHYRQMEKADRDSTHVLRAEEECRQLLTQFPNSRFAPQAAQRLRQIQDVIAEAEYRVGAFYHAKGSFPAAANRLKTMTETYPLYSAAPLALLKQGESYGKMGNRFRNETATAYQKIVREYPLSPEVEEAKRRLTEMEAEIPEADPVALARMKYEQENATERGFWGSFWGVLAKGPDTSRAAKSGQPTMQSLRPAIPASIPIPGEAGGATTTDVTASQVSATNGSELDTKPDARLNQPGGGEIPAAAAAQPAAAAKDDGKKKDAKKQPAKKEEKKKK